MKRLTASRHQPLFAHAWIAVAYAKRLGLMLSGSVCIDSKRSSACCGRRAFPHAVIADER